MKNFRLQPESSSPFLSILQPLHFSSCLDGSYLWIRYSIGFTFHLYPTVYFDHLLRKFLRTPLTLSNESKTILIIRIMSIFPSPFLLPLEIPSNFNESFEKKEKKKPKPILLNQRRRTVSIRATVQHPNNSNKFFSRQTFLPTLSSRSILLESPLLPPALSIVSPSSPPPRRLNGSFIAALSSFRLDATVK